MKIEDLHYNDIVKKLLFDKHNHTELLDGDTIVYTYEDVIKIIEAAITVQPPFYGKGGIVKPCTSDGANMHIG